MVPSPVVALNRAVAVSMAHGAAVGLGLLDFLDLEASREDYLPYHVGRADMFRRLGRTVDSRDAYRSARELARNDTLCAFIERKIQELG